MAKRDLIFSEAFVKISHSVVLVKDRNDILDAHWYDMGLNDW